MLPQIKNTNTKKMPIIYPEFDFKMNFDGCSKGNPGLGGAGAVIYHDGDEIWSESFFVGEKVTNNNAEYAGLILGLQQAVDMNIKILLVEGDSELVISQMTGKYKCNSPNLILLHERAKELEKNFEKVNYQHILRNFNKRADILSNIPIEEYYKIKI